MKQTLTLILLLFQLTLLGQEICNNGIDDDGDFLVDLNDPDCECLGLEQLTNTQYIPNSDFESYEECPNTDPLFEGYVEDWFKPSSNGTSSSFWNVSYFNTCGTFESSSWNSSVPFPLADDGQGYIGMRSVNSSSTWSYENYFGVCLNEPFEQGQTYVISVDVGFVNNSSGWWEDSTCTLYLYGNPDCDPTNTFSGNNYTTAGWTEMTSSTETGDDEWKTMYLTFTPTTDMESIMFLPSHSNTTWWWGGYFYFDNIKVVTASIDNEIAILHENPCDLEDSLKSATVDTSSAVYQWYKDGIALVGETDSIIVDVASNYGAGWYQSVVTVPGYGCQALEPIYFGQDAPNAFNFTFDTSYCDPKPLKISLDEHYGTVSWGTGETSRSIRVDEGGTYVATITYDGGCTVTDSVTIDTVEVLPIRMLYTIGDKEGEYVEVPDDILLACSNDTIHFVADMGIDVPFSWSTELPKGCNSCDTSFAFLNDNEGVFVLNALTGDCRFTDTVGLVVDIVNNYIGDTTICASAPLVFQDQVYNLTNDTLLYLVLKNVTNCDSIVVLTVTVKDSISSTWNLSVDSCSNECTGTIIQTSTDGVVPIAYNWSNGSLNTNQFDLCSGDYNVTLTDAEGCISRYDFNVPETNAVTSSYLLSDFNDYNVSCANASDGSIDVSTDGGNGPVEISWNDDPTTSFNRSNLTANQYVYTLTDSMNCTLVDTALLVEPMLVELTTTNVKNLVCFEAGDGRIEVDATGGIEAYTYQWTPNVSSTNSAEQLEANNYEIIVFDQNNCQDTVNINLTEGAQILPYVSTVDVSCYGFVDGEISLDSIVNGIGELYYKIDDGPFKVATNFPIVEDFIEPATYSLTVLDSNECQNSIVFEVGSPDSLTLIFSPMDDVTLSLGQSVDLSAYSYNNEAIIEWSDDILCNGCNQYTYFPTQNTSITATAIDTTSGCYKSETIYIQLLKERAVFIANVFSPNGDGHNDRLTINARQDAIVNIDEFTIFNRFGATVYSVSDMSPNDYFAGWDGSFKGAEAPVGIYVYYTTIEFIDGRTMTFQGEVSLIR